MLSSAPPIGETGLVSLSPASMQDSFTFVAGNGLMESATATVAVTIVALAGDADMDGWVSVLDLATLANSYGKVNLDWSEGDFNGDYQVDIQDLGIIAGTYGTLVHVTLVAATATAAFVPAPTLDWALAQLDLPELDAALPR